MENWDLAGLKPTLINAVLLLLMLAVVVNVGKFAMSKWPIPGLAPLINNI